MQFFLLRHCTVEDRYAGCFRGGKLDADLSTQGKLDAKAQAEFLYEQNISCVITTGLKRTDIVGRLLADKGIKHRIEPLFREIDFGAWDGKPEQDVIAEYPEAHRLYRQCWEEKRGEDIMIPDGESMHDVLNRVAEGWGNISREHRDRFAIVSHSVAITCLLSHILQKKIKDVPYTHLGQIHELEKQNDVRMVKTLNVADLI